MIKIYHYFSDLNAFRDDSHMTAWRPYAVSGVAREMFKFVFRSQVYSAADLYNQPAYRGYARNDIASALNSLIELDWLGGNKPEFEVTDKGNSTYARAEELTDQYFFAPGCNWVMRNCGKYTTLLRP